jgi:hypothetical protein
MSQIKPLSRRHFSKSLAIAAGAIAGSRLIRPRRVAAQSDETTNLQIIDAAYTFMQEFQWTLDQSPDPFANNVNWQGFLGSTLTTIAVLRQHGLDQWMNEEATDHAWLAWMEGGWDQYWALQTIPIVGLMSDWLGDSFDNFRTTRLGNVWIYNNGPLSSQYDGIGGWAELPPWPGTFPVFGEANGNFVSGNRLIDDDVIRETVGIPQNVPWFDVLNPYVPNVALGPLPSLIIWKSAADRCKALTDAQIALETGAGLTLILVNLDRKSKIILLMAGAVLRVMKNHYC